MTSKRFFIGPARIGSPLLCVAAAFVCAAVAVADPAPKIAIIIDDLGYEMTAGRRVVNLPGPITCAVLPSTPRARDLAHAAHAAGKEVLLHLPLQSESDKGEKEPGLIVLDTTREEFATSFAASFESVPFAIGVNSHRGSLLTRHPGHMQWLMDEIAARGKLLFVDSYTTHRSVALRLAREKGVPAVRRDVFLDSNRDEQSVRREFDRLKRLARSRGLAIGIGHPYPETLALLEKELPRLTDEGFELISVSEYVALKDRPSAATDRLTVHAFQVDTVD
ncbi:MAG: divergent polysaccharide deacetylase family protein [Gammaproteobacteria bacterium]|nr:divergent polysaccharide deacetylase family protein [Gammaproteobacteria bacterium]MDH4316606.1 divergent polysaccharide deacetylase family protein [Gammaproteobacteria bacterium]MDH5215359.1 divergent polysaccharide deacetylase family protein [Gammaproteobacteria bacterium]